MNFACKEPLSAVFSLKKLFAIGEFIITLFWFTSVPSLLCFESFTVCKCGSPLTCFSMASFAAFSVPLIHLCEKFLISLILSSHFLQSEHWMQQTLDSVLISKSSFSYNSLPISKYFYHGCFLIWSHCINHGSSKSKSEK